MSGSVRIPTGEKKKLQLADGDGKGLFACLDVVLGPFERATKAFQRLFIGSLERFFQFFGEKVAKHPFITIVVSLILFLLCMSGMTQYETEDDELKLWLPLGTDFTDRSYYLDEVFTDEGRHHSIVVYSENGNVLSADNLREIYALRQAIVDIRTDNGATWPNRCDRIHRSQVSSSTGGGDEVDQVSFPTAVFPDEVCQALEAEEENSDKVCSEHHVFEMWANEGQFDAATKSAIDALTDADVLAAINRKPIVSGLTGSDFFPTTVLGTIGRDGGNIVSAKAMTLNFVGFDTDEDGSLEHDMTMDFEQAIIDLVNGYEFSPGSDLKALPNAHRSREDISGSDTDSDLQLFFVGYVLVGVYVTFMLGKFNQLETRFGLTFVGLLAIGFGLISAMGLCSYIGWFASDINQIMPFLILGIGIDDMFVIAQNFDNLEASDLPLEKKMGVCLRHAAMAITITTLTDVLAFVVGASTALPALRYFCLYCAFAIFFVYVYMLTFFFAFFVYDQRRILAQRNAFCCCVKVADDYQPNECSQKPLLPRFFMMYAKLLLNRWTKLAILLLTTILLVVGIYGTSQLEANFDSNLFIPEDNYLRDWIEAKDEYFPTGGMVGAIYIRDVQDIHSKMHIVKRMREELASLDILSDVSGKGGFDDDLESFVDFTQPQANYPETALTKDAFYENVAEFLFTVGKNQIEGLRFKDRLQCARSTPELSLLSVPYRHLGYEDANEEIEKMNEMNDFAAKYRAELAGGDGSDVFPMSPSYGDNVFMEILVDELYRNVLLAMVCVFCSALLLIANVTASVLVAGCVFITIIDVGGFMYVWGLNIDTIAAILITISLGIAVDYTAHIAHNFMVSHGSRDERVFEALSGMGPAVLNGGISTFLAFCVLAFSKSIVFKIFFKIFFLVVVLGLYHGLVFLPVVLSYIGPDTSHSLDAGDHHGSSKVQPDPEIATISNKDNDTQSNGSSGNILSNTVVTTTHGESELNDNGFTTNGTSTTTNGSTMIHPSAVVD